RRHPRPHHLAGCRRQRPLRRQARRPQPRRGGRLSTGGDGRRRPDFRHVHSGPARATVPPPLSGESAMPTTRRDLLKLGGLAAAGAMLPSFAAARAALADIPKADTPLSILVLGGTGFTGPFQVAYALARGHRVTTFNR